MLNLQIYTDLYRIGEAQRRMIKADKMVFMGTSFSVNITSIALNIGISNNSLIEVVDPNPINLDLENINYYKMTAEEYINSLR